MCATPAEAALGDTVQEGLCGRGLAEEEMWQRWRDPQVSDGPCSAPSAGAPTCRCSLFLRACKEGAGQASRETPKIDPARGVSIHMYGMWLRLPISLAGCGAGHRVRKDSRIWKCLL